MQLTIRKNTNINLPVVEDMVGEAEEDIVVRVGDSILHAIYKLRQQRSIKHLCPTGLS